MAKDLMVILDNSMYCINQDYPGNTRIGHQIEGVKTIVNKILSESTESTIGVMTTGRGATTKIVSPTGSRNTVYTYLHEIEPDAEIEEGNSISISRMALKYRTNPTQGMLLFLGSPVDDANLMLIADAITEALDSNISVGVVLFGEATEYYTLFKSAIEECTDFTCVKIEAGESFSEGISTALRENLEETDPEIELAIKRSLQDVRQNKEEDDEDLQRAINESLNT